MDTKQIEKLAQAAKLKFNDSDLKVWSDTMQKIFAWLDQLEEVDTSSVTNTDMALAKEVLREDAAATSPDREAVLAGVPELEDNMAKVKKVL